MPLAPVEPTMARTVASGSIGCLGVSAVLVVLVVAFLVVIRACSTGLETGPDGPGTGTASLRLPVDVTPRSDLQPGQLVRVTSSAFEARTIVAITQCLPAADTESAGTGACDLDGGSRYAVGDDGNLDITVAARRMITVDREAHDCAAVPGRCLVVAAAADDHDRSGGRRIGFAEDLPPIVATPAPPRPQSLHLAVSATPVSPHRDGQDVTIRAEGFVPGEPILLAWCTDDFEADGPYACEPEDLDQAVGALLGRTVDGIDGRAGDDGTVEVVLPARARITPFGGEGPVTCTAARPCWFAVAAAADTQRSALVEYSVAG